MTSEAGTNEINIAPFKQGFVSINKSYGGVKLCYYCNFEAVRPLIGGGKPVLLLLHGYPQSSFIWRHVAPMLSKAGYPVAVFDLPGYGNSRDPEHTIPQDKFSTGSAVLQALASLLPSSSQPHPLVIIAHDRGARIAHRIAVSRSSFSAFQLKAVSLMDIVPTTVQFAAFGKAKEACTYWHWPFLANVEIATKLILAFGGENWIRMTFGRTAGKSAQGLQKLEEDNAAKVYGAHMDREDVVRASCEDYAAAAGVDLERQAEDQEAGRKIDVPVLLIFSAAQLGARFDVEGIWRKDWVKEGVEVEALPVGDGIGHYVPEEAPDVVGERLLGWLMGF